MIKDIAVEVEERELRGKNACRRLRAAGGVPGVVYGLKRPAFAVTVSPRRVEEVLREESGRNTIFDLVLATDADKKRAVMIREIQRDPVTERIVHIDFVRVDLEKRIVVNVPVRLVGIPAGVKTEGGVVDFIHRSVEVECLPAVIPGHLDVDVSELELNQQATVAGIQPIESVKILDAAETVLAVVNAPRAEIEPTAEEAEVAAVPGEEAEDATKAEATEAPDEGKGKGKGKGGE